MQSHYRFSWRLGVVLGLAALLAAVCAPTAAEVGVDWVENTDSADWTARQGHASVVFDGKIWILGGVESGPVWKNDVWYSSDGATWAQATAEADWHVRCGHTAIVHDGKMWVIGGIYDSSWYHYLNDVWSSADGINWTEATAEAAFLQLFA